MNPAAEINEVRAAAEASLAGDNAAARALIARVTLERGSAEGEFIQACLRSHYDVLACGAAPARKAA